MPLAPPCRQMGRHCFALDVTLRVGDTEGLPDGDDHEATWLLGHTERIHFGSLQCRGRHLYANARLHVPCRFLATSPGGIARCQAHGYATTQRAPKRIVRPRHLGQDTFEIVERGRLVRRSLPPPGNRRSLPVLSGSNPCLTAKCRTGDNAIGAACCRDLQIEILCSSRPAHLEALLRSRKAPYLCKIARESPDSLSAEMISACSFLAGDRMTCSLHGRIRPDGRTAKPDLCSAWPEVGDTYHRACALVPRDVADNS